MTESWTVWRYFQSLSKQQKTKEVSGFKSKKRIQEAIQVQIKKNKDK
jgi:hypothetical protein